MKPLRLICLLLPILFGACTRAPTRTPVEPAATPELAMRVPDAVEHEPAAPSTPAPPTIEPPPTPDLWQRLRSGMRFADCAATPIMSIRAPRDPASILTQLQTHAALIDFILRELTARDLPSEFALLPMIESDYRPLRTHGNQPAGMWQFMPITAREYNLRADADYDMRVDFVQSTRAAARYLADLGVRFEQDWILVNMAFNAGEYRVKRALRAHAQRPPPYARLALNSITRAHTTRLIALACLIAEPERHGLTLAAPQAPALSALTLRHDLDIALAAQLAGVAYSELRAWNPGSLRGRQPRGTALLLPHDARATLRAALKHWPQTQRTGWPAWRSDGSLDWAALARGSAYDGAALARLHRSDLPGPARGTYIALPPGSALAARLGTRLESADGRYTVRTGDSLWLIARRHGVGVADLLAWNNLSHTAVLRPGQRLRVAAP